MHRRPYGPLAWLVDDVASSRGVGGGVALRWTCPASTRSCRRNRPWSSAAPVPATMRSARCSTWSCRPISPPQIDSALTIDVVYDGPDIGELADAAQISIDDVVRLHSTGTYEVAFCGFSPGSATCGASTSDSTCRGGTTPRTSVPAGSIGVAAGYTCVYPSASPGGWYLIGHTNAALWDADRDPPALLTPGRAVRFRRVVT